MNYVDRIVSQLAEHLDGCEPDLLRLYALLALVKGEDVNEEDVHDAWSGLAPGPGPCRAYVGWSAGHPACGRGRGRAPRRGR